MPPINAFNALKTNPPYLMPSTNSLLDFKKTSLIEIIMSNCSEDMDCISDRKSFTLSLVEMLIFLVT